MKILYVYFSNLKNENPANILQTMNMLNAFGKKTELTYLSVWISKKKFSNILNFLSLPKHFKHIRLPVKFSKSSLLIEKISRASYAMLSLTISKLNNNDVIYTRDFSFLYFISLLPKILRPKQPIIFEPHNILHKVSTKISLEQEKKGMRMASLFIPTTEGSRQDLEKVFNINSKKILVQPNAVNLEIFWNVEKNSSLFLQKYPTTLGEKIIIYTGSFQNWKGVDILVKSVHYIKEKAFKLLLVGGAGKEKKVIEDLVVRENLTDKVIIIDTIPQKEMIHALKNADISIIPNIKMPEGMRYTSPLKTYEYMAAGLPIVASDLFAMRQLLKENENCLFFESENEKDLAEKINILLKNDDLRSVMGNKNQLKAKEYGWGERANNILNFIKINS